MTRTFENDSEVIVYALEMIVSFSQENQYLFVANCAWWIAGVIGLDNRLTSYIDNLESKRAITDNRAISETPRDIARGVSPEKQSSDYIPDPLRRTRKGRINPLPQSKCQLKRARKALHLIEAKEAKSTIRYQRLKEIRTQVIQNLNKE
jgi:hypothetical protein